MYVRIYYFVQHAEDAEKCLSAKELHLRDQRVEAHRALHRNDVENKKKLKETRVRDTRNLYLVKEGGNEKIVYFTT